MSNVRNLDLQLAEQIQHRIDDKTKPLGALGDLEVLARQLVLIFSQRMDVEQFATTRFAINNPQLVVFAGDHGIAAHGVSIAPSEVTGQMVANFANGGSAINVLCRQFDWQLSVVDCGILHAPEPKLGVISQRLGRRTASFTTAAAMSDEQLEQGLAYGKQLVETKLAYNCNLLAFGEMGIGNTSSAAAIFSALSGLAPEHTVGRGTGVSDDVHTKKRRLIEQALLFHSAQLNTALDILRCLGGFEICQMVGAMLAAAQQQKAIVVDGFIATAAAMLTIEMEPASRDYMIFAHNSGEQGHAKMLTYLQVKPLLNLGLRLGEGTGAALCLPILQSALAIYNDMASFSQAQVTDVVSA
ncbi:nicotinate-nucleotide--dimethylbenzimidazole phosphoribosyltransferase [Pseudoalteromonas byunsanensis]|uniref:Nicotinate-nucleotide--dimethylbenzimidazole phosphoribosyltransferase n=1 Tax=Pseudoalteromonas byunsanensis TaxID=327939 RepID=A0A1S1NDU0_9GAMM|nr:nicotinate-nucleotide--dimethylbenzimidazole phosphoribosyltransferase [Pseudoalteromonas byunsanensis]OHU97679.1 nicotinate-nucleotide--dimethylbenzimidazole phosphoribosyltransferase [Pseudoalteromonas byunsanensis]